MVDAMTRPCCALVAADGARSSIEVDNLMGYEQAVSVFVVGQVYSPDDLARISPIIGRFARGRKWRFAKYRNAAEWAAAVL